MAVRLAGWRPGTAVANFAEIISALARAARKLLLLRDSFGKFSRVRRKVVEHPVDPSARGCIGIIHDERKAQSIWGRIVPFQLRSNVRAVTGEFFWDRFSGRKGIAV